MKIAFWIYTAVLFIANGVLLACKLDTALPFAGLLVLLVLAMLFKVNMMSPPQPDERNRNKETFSMEYVSNKPNNEKNWPFVRRYFWVLIPPAVCLVAGLVVRAL